MAGWEVWLSSSLADLTQRNLVRTLRPTIPSSSAAEVTAGGVGRQRPPVGELARELVTLTLAPFATSRFPSPMRIWRLGAAASRPPSLPCPCWRNVPTCGRSSCSA